jgi:hypothetical protein
LDAVPIERREGLSKHTFMDDDNDAVDPLSVPIEEVPLTIEEEIACIKKVLDVLLTDFLALQERVNRHIG